MKEDSNQSSSQKNSSEQRIAEKIQKSGLAQLYISTQLDQMIQSCEEFFLNDNPSTAIRKRMERTSKNNADNKKRIDQILEENIHLKAQNARLTEKNKAMHQSNHAPNKNQNAMQEEHPDSPAKQFDPAEREKNLGCVQQAKSLKYIESMQQTAKDIAKLERKQYTEFQIYISRVVQRSLQKFKFQALQTSSVSQNNTDTITIKRDQYLRLVEFYSHTIAMTLFKNISKQPQIGQGNDQIDEFSQQAQVLKGLPSQQIQKPEILERFFEQLANKKQLTKEWNLFLSNNRDQSIAFKAKIQYITSGKDEPQDKKITKENTKLIKQQQNRAQQLSFEKDCQDQTNDTTSTPIIEQAQGSIENILFKKIMKIIELKQLKFSEKQIELFRKFNQKRKCGRIYSPEQALLKLKNKEDVFELSKEWSLSLIRTLNLSTLRLMQMVTDWNNPQIINSFGHKLSAKSEEIKQELHSRIQQECSNYLEQRMKNLKSLQTLKLQDIKFDKQIKLQAALVKIVDQYSEILEDNLFFCNRQIKISMR